MNKQFAGFLLLALILPVVSFQAQEEKGNDKPPVPPEPFPAAYQDDEILSTGVSPDGRYGLIYPKEELSVDVEHPRLLLVELKPFRVVIEISHDTYLEHGHNSYSVTWNKDSSAVLVTANIKWGPEKVFLVPIHDGQAGKIVDLAPLVKALVRPSYKKSRALVSMSTSTSSLKAITCRPTTCMEGARTKVGTSMNTEE